MWPINRIYATPEFDAGRGNLWRWGTKTYMMGVVNATDDSFSGDGVAGQVERAVALAQKFQADGMDIIDVGGASSRPGATPTPISIEKNRVVPIIEAISSEVDLPISIDTTWAEVAEAGLDAGATVVNDISDRGFRPNSNRELRDRDKFFDWQHGKWHDGSCPVGPCVACPESVPDPQTLPLQLTVNGEVHQDASTAMQIFPVAAVIEFISSFVTLEAGDIISTGTAATGKICIAVLAS